MKFYEKITRLYSNNVSIIYEIIDNNIYIHSIISLNRKRGFASDALREFINDFKDKNIYLYASSELGTDIDILNAWYEKIGFIKYKNISFIPYNITHAILNI